MTPVLQYFLKRIASGLSPVTQEFGQSTKYHRAKAMP
jgi:hypothetical protein